MKNNSESDNDNFLIALACSIALHLLLLYLFVFGLPSLFYKQPIEEQVISFEMLPVSAVANIPTKQKQIDKATEAENAKKVLQAKSEEKKEVQEQPKPPVEEQPKTEESKEKIAETPKKPEPKQPEPEKAENKEAEIVKIEKKKEEKPKEDKPKEEEKKTAEQVAKKPEKPKNDDLKKLEKELEKAVQDKPKPAEKKKKIASNSEMDSLLKNLERASEGTSDKSDKKSQKQGNANTTSKGNFNEDMEISTNIQNIIRQQLQKFWSPPVGSQNLENATVSVLIILDKEGNVIEVKVLSKICPGILDSTCQALAESVERAILQASPIQNLPAQYHDIWKEIKSNFSPKDLN